MYWFKLFSDSVRDIGALGEASLLLAMKICSKKEKNVRRYLYNAFFKHGC